LSFGHLSDRGEQIGVNFLYRPFQGVGVVSERINIKNFDWYIIEKRLVLMMVENMTTKITVTALINSSIAKVWKFWTTPVDIIKWNNASDDWHTTKAENDLREGGKFLSRMEAKDGSFGFDFEGVYDKIENHKLIEYSLADGRKISIKFIDLGMQTEVSESFDAETVNPVELQRSGWQAILNNFKKYAEVN
jgi:uncharacterized protein YndB with AHSA1/START domain